ncbi:DUF957 domain-containing protein [Escherichia coli]
MLTFLVSVDSGFQGIDETALDILIAWLQDNIDCESGIIFDNNEDKTDSAALLPCIEQAREDIRTLRQLQLQHQNR